MTLALTVRQLLPLTTSSYICDMAIDAILLDCNRRAVTKVWMLPAQLLSHAKAVVNIMQQAHILVTLNINVGHSKRAMYVVPCFDKGRNHWFLTVMKHDRAYIFDTLISHNYTKTVDRLNSIFQSLIKKKYKFLIIDTPQQENAFDCGPLMCAIVEYIVSSQNMFDDFIKDEAAHEKWVACFPKYGKRSELLRNLLQYTKSKRKINKGI
jgi:Ulp1 protease family, C-terminal catalytic domain